MGRKTDHQTLSINIPTFFRCPISLDVMRSPVSLCTGVTYDRASITRWLDSGNTTCPATMQTLPSTDLIPNITLHNLIRIWAASASASNNATGHVSFTSDLARDIMKGGDHDVVPALQRLGRFFSDPDIEEFAKNSLLSGSGSGLSAGCSANLAGIISSSVSSLQAVETALEIAAHLLAADYIDAENKKRIGDDLSLKLDRFINSLIRVFKAGRVDSRVSAARVLYFILTTVSPQMAHMAVETPDLVELIMMLLGTMNGKDGRIDRGAVDAGLHCLVAMLPVRGAKVKMVTRGIVPVLVSILETSLLPVASAEKALKLMEAAAGCSEGREAICGNAKRCVWAVMEKMMKVGKVGTEAAVTVLWNVCHLYRDRRAIEAVTAGGGGMTKFLLLMQSYCSPTTRQKAGDLMKIFRVNTKSCLSGYDTKTTHIMPF